MQKQFSKMKNSLDPFGALCAFEVMVNQPYTLPKHLLDWVTGKYHFIVSNINASKITYTFCGKKQLGQFYYCTGIGSVNNGISIATTGNIMSMALYADEN